MIDQIMGPPQLIWAPKIQLTYYWCLNHLSQLEDIHTLHETGPFSIKQCKLVTSQMRSRWVFHRGEHHKTALICSKICQPSGLGVQVQRLLTSLRMPTVPMPSRHWWQGLRPQAYITDLQLAIHCNRTIRLPRASLTWKILILPRKSLSSRRQQKWIAHNAVIFNLRCLLKAVLSINLRSRTKWALRNSTCLRVEASRQISFTRLPMCRIQAIPGLIRKPLKRQVLRWHRWEVLSHQSCLMSWIKHKWHSHQMPTRRVRTKWSLTSLTKLQKRLM